MGEAALVGNTLYANKEYVYLKYGEDIIVEQQLSWGRRYITTLHMTGVVIRVVGYRNMAYAICSNGIYNVSNPWVVKHILHQGIDPLFETFPHTHIATDHKLYVSYCLSGDHGMWNSVKNHTTVGSEFEQTDGDLKFRIAMLEADDATEIDYNPIKQEADDIGFRIERPVYGHSLYYFIFSNGLEVNNLPVCIYRVVRSQLIYCDSSKLFGIRKERYHLADCINFKYINSSWGEFIVTTDLTTIKTYKLIEGSPNANIRLELIATKNYNHGYVEFDPLILPYYSTHRILRANALSDITIKTN